MFWFVQGNAATGVDAVDEDRRRRSLSVLDCCGEEDEVEKAKGESEKGPIALFIYKAGRISGMRENRGENGYVTERAPQFLEVH